MIVKQLVELLEDCDPDAEVLLAHQPGWPLQFHVAGVAEWDGTEGEVDEPVAGDEPVVYIAEGSHPDDSPYCSREIWDVARSA